MRNSCLIFAGVVFTIVCSFAQLQPAPAGLTDPFNLDAPQPQTPPSGTDDWAVVDSFLLDIAGPTGLTFDGEYFWITNYQSSASSCIYRVSMTGLIMGSIPSPDMWPCGLTYDGEYLWCHDFVVGHSVYPTIMSMCKVETVNGNVLEMLQSAYTFFSGGCAWDGECIYYGKKTSSSPPCACYIYKLDPVSGAHLDTIPVTTGDIYGLTYYNDHLWYSDSYTDMYYEIDLEGNIVDSSPAPGPEPSGMTTAEGFLYNVDNTNHYLYKIEIGAPSNIAVELTPHNPPIQIPPGGGTFSFELLIENLSGSAQTFDGWTLVIFPNNVEYPLITRLGINLPPGGSIERTMTQNVPAVALPGNYQYVLNVGDHPSTIEASDSFPFTKLADDGGVMNPNKDWTVEGWNEGVGISAAPEDFATVSAYPNPFNPTANIAYAVTEAGYTRVSVFNVLGSEIAVLSEGYHQPGVFELKFNAGSLPGGVYFLQVNTPNSASVKKLLLLK